MSITIGLLFVGLCVAFFIAMRALDIKYDRLYACNDITRNHRHYMLDAIKGADRDGTYLRMLAAVDYHEHYQALVGRRNPFALYDPKLMRRCAAYQIEQQDKVAA